VVYLRRLDGRSRQRRARAVRWRLTNRAAVRVWGSGETLRKEHLASDARSLPVEVV
jgi:hypothetical protein